MNLEELKSLSRIYNQENNLCIAKEYMESRGLPDDPRIRYCHFLPSVNVRNQLVIFGKSFNGLINTVESRGLTSNTYEKLYQSDVSIPLWNMEKYTGQKNIIITEAVIDAESIQLLQLEDTLAISTYRASYSMSQFYYIMAVFNKSNIHICYDQDSAGINGAKKFIESSSKLFQKDVNMIELSLKDPNMVLVKRGINQLRRDITSQV